MDELLKILYGHSMELDADRVDRHALCGLSAGYLSMYRLGLLFPWTLEGVTDLVPVHGRVKRIAWRLEPLSRDADIPVSERVDYVAGLLGSYVMGTDTELVARGLETAWKLLHGHGGERLSLPCRTAGMCRLLSQCHYFTGDRECLKLAGGLVTEALGRSNALTGEKLLAWREALRLYADVSDGSGDGGTGMEAERLEEELRRLESRARRVEDEMLEAMRRGEGADDVVAFSQAFALVTRRMLDDCIETEGKKI